MSVVERALKRLQSKGIPKSVVGATPVARVARNVERQSSLFRDVGVDSITGQGRVVEFNFEALSDAGLYSAGNSRLADEYRMIKRPVLKKAMTTNDPNVVNGNLIMVSSALAGEGKTFTSVNLSLSLASEKDWNVLLVDVDCRNPQLSELLGVSEEPGLLDVLGEDRVDLESVVMPTNIERLSVLPLGTGNDHAAEYLASARMRELCERLASARNQLIVFDSSPLLLTAEAPILSSRMGQLLLVVSANQTPRQAVVDAVDKIGGEIAIGLVLNKVDQDEDVIRYGYYGGYGQRKYYDEKK